jgi:plastocyanin
MSEHSRRTFLASAGAVSALALAGCSGDDGDGGGDDQTTTAPDDDGDSDNGGSEFVETDSIDMTDDLVFDPDQVQVSSGTTVTWETVGAVGHTVTAYEDDIPDDAAFFASGDFDSEEAAIDGYTNEQAGDVAEGETYEHAFETTGTYEYYCIPHEMNGMIATIEVV